MAKDSSYSVVHAGRDAIAGMVVFLVALPLCLGIAIASGADPFAGILAGIVGGIVVGILSGSHTSVSGPAAGLTAIVLAQIASLGDYRIFLLAVVGAGLIQVVLGIGRAGSLAAFFPSSVIKGLLAAIGVILILKQIPHVLGHDTDAEGEMAFQQPDHENTLSELFTLFGEGQIHPGAMVIGLISIVVLVGWDAFKPLKKSLVPVQLIVVAVGVGISLLFANGNPDWQIGTSHLVDLPVVDAAANGGTGTVLDFLRFPDFSPLFGTKPDGSPTVALTTVVMAAITLAIVASLETLLNLEAIDKIDPKQRKSPASRELIAQGIGNITCGMLGGIPVTSVIVRGSVNILSGAVSKVSTIFHGVLLAVSVLFLTKYLNMIPISCLAAILLVTGFKLASPSLFRAMWKEGHYQFLPFIITLVAIVFTDLLVGTMIGLGIAVIFILNSNLRRPLRTVRENYPGGEVTRIVLSNQVSFLNRAAIERSLFAIPRQGQVLIDGSQCDYIDPDIISLIQSFKRISGPARGVSVSFRGFHDKFQIQDEIRFLDYPTRELQKLLTAEEVLQLLREGNDRFRTGQRLQRDFERQIGATSRSQHPLAVVLSCIDSRSPAEIVFDLGLGDIFSVRVAGNVTSPKVFGSIEYSVACAGAKLIVVLGHTSCGAVTAAVNFAATDENVLEATGCQNLGPIVSDIFHSVDMTTCHRIGQAMTQEKSQFVDSVARKNVIRSVKQIAEQSGTISQLVMEGKVAIVGAMYDISTGSVEFLVDDAIGLRL